MSEVPEENPVNAPLPPPPDSSTVNAGNITTSGPTNIGPQYNMIVKTVKEAFDDGRRAPARQFADRDACDVTEAREEELKALYIDDGQLIDSLVAVLERERVLFLSGARGLGKQTTALYVATRIAEAHSLEHSTALIAPLDAQIRFELRDVTDVTDSPRFRRCVIVFDDALAKKNASLIDIFAKFERAACDQLAGDLRSNDAYLIVAAANDDLDPFREQLGRYLHIREIGGPLPQLLVEEGYARKLARVCADKDKAGHVEALTSKRELVIDRLKTLPELASFIDFYLKRDDADLDSALDDFTDRGRWFRTSLAADFDAWCCVLALLLARATPDPEPVAWLDFERLRRAISDRLKADEELFPPWREKERGRAAPTSGESVDDDALRNRAQVEAISDRFGHTVRFIEPVKAADLWKTVLVHNRRVLTAVIPALRTLAEQQRAVERFTLRAIAAQAIGRIGEIDPERIINPLVRHWGGSDEFRPLVGCLLQGMLGSRDERYREGVWQHIATLAENDGDDADARLLTAIVAYAQVGIYDRRRAMECLGAIVKEQLAPAMENLHQAARSADIASRTAAESHSKRRAQALYKHRERLMRLASAIDSKYMPALMGMGKAVAYIAEFGTDNNPIGTLTAMRDWISKGGKSSGIIVAMLFLRAIADELIPEDVASSALLFALATRGKAAISEMAAFLADVYEGIHSTYALPADVQGEMRSEFADCLTGWARAAVDVDAFRSPVEDLFVILTKVRTGLMCDDIYTLLGSSAFEDEAMRAFAIAVRKRLG